MPIITRLVIWRSSVEDGHSPSASRACMIWPTISAGARLRTRRWVPVWQKRQVRVQPTWLEMHSVPRSVSGMCTLSTSWPSGKRSSHLAVPSLEFCALATSGRSTTKCSARRARKSLLRLVMAEKSVAPR